jgi:uncharacterized OB-fold protein
MNGVLRALILMMAAGLWLCGCGKSPDQALESDANGFLCLSCKTKFYTDRKVFASRCPSCQKQPVERVLGFQCAADKHVTFAPRTAGSALCEQCRKSTSAVVFPRKADLVAWGAEFKKPAEVGGY